MLSIKWWVRFTTTGEWNFSYSLVIYKKFQAEVTQHCWVQAQGWILSFVGSRGVKGTDSHPLYLEHYTWSRQLELSQFQPINSSRTMDFWKLTKSKVAVRTYWGNIVNKIKKKNHKPVTVLYFNTHDWLFFPLSF